MGKKYRYVLRALSLVAMLSYKLPGYLQDGQLSIGEIVNVLEGTFDICGWKTKIDIPEEIAGTMLAFELLDEED